MTDPHLGEFEQLVLIALVRRGGDAFGVDVADEIQVTAQRDVSLPAVYVTLARLEAKGLVRSRRDRGETGRGNRARKRFRLEAEGAQALEQARRTMERMWTGVARPVRGGSSA